MTRDSYPPTEPPYQPYPLNGKARESPIADRLMRNTDRLHKAIAMFADLRERLSPISRQPPKVDGTNSDPAEVCMVERCLGEQERMIDHLALLIEEQIDNLRI